MLVTLMFAPAWGFDIKRPARTSSEAGAQSASPASLSAAIACRERFRSPVVTLIRRRPSETTARTASLTVQPNRSFNALKAERGIFRPRPVRCAPILRLKKRSVLGVTILPLTFNRLVQGKRQVRQTTGSLVRSDRSDAWRFQRMGLISCQFDGSGRGCQPFAGGSGV